MPLLLNQIRLVSWDVDGTLYSIGRMKFHLFRRLIHETVLGRGSQARKDLTLLKSHRETIERMRASGVIQNPNQTELESILVTEKRWYGAALRKTGLRKGAREAIKFFAAKGCQQVVYSDYEADYKLEALGLNDTFQRTYVGEVLGFLKPNPRVLEMIAREGDVALNSLLHIGDRSETDGRQPESQDVNH